MARAPVKQLTKRKPTGFATADWTKARQQAFLDHLGATANVAGATKKVKFKEGASYDFRRKSSDFRIAWQAALCEGYAKLELMMLERAMIALAPAVDDGAPTDPARAKADEYSNKLVLALLAAHRASVRGEKSEASAKAVAETPDPRTEIERRFSEMRSRMGAPADEQSVAAA